MVFLILLVITAVAIVLLQTFVGILMVIAMLALPAGCSSVFARSLAGMMFISCIFSMIFIIFGLVFSWIFNLPSGAITVIIATVVFLAISVIRVIKKR